MDFSTWSIRNPVPPILLFALLSIAGLFAFDRMMVQNLPDTDFPTVTVSAALPGAAPPLLESEVARRIEDAIAPIQGLKTQSTTIQDGMVNLTATFRLEKPVQEAVDDVRSAVQGIRSDLPSALRDPVIAKLDIAAAPIIAYTIRSNRMDEVDLSWYVDNDLSRRLKALEGVGAVKRVGGLTRQIRVELDPVRMEALGATAAAISQQLTQVQTDATSGEMALGAGKQPLRLMARADSAESLANIELSLPGGQRFRLADVAMISDTHADQESLALQDGKPAIGFEISRSRGADEVEVGKRVRESIRQLRAERPDMVITEVFNFVDIAEEEFHASMHMLYEGAILAVVVVFLFLRDARATLIAAVTLPLSILPAFAGMYFMGFTLNWITLLALTLVIGVLVDDAIVEIENIERHIGAGKTPLQAAMDAAREIGLAVIATSLTLVAVFLPTAFMDGLAGKFFRQFGWTASIAVLVSLMVARLITPMMSAYLMKPHKRKHPEPFWMPQYLRMSRWTLEHPWKTLALAISFFAASLTLIPLLPQAFLAPDDNSQTQVYLELPPGSTLAQTRNVTEKTISHLQSVPHVRSVYATIGAGRVGGDILNAPGASDTRTATLTVTLAPRGQRPRKQVIETNIRTALKSLPGIRSKVGLSGSGEKYLLVLSGEDLQALLHTATEVQRDLRKIPGLGNIASSASLLRNEIILRPDYAKAAELGVTPAAIAETLRVATVGDYDPLLPKLNLAQRQIPILVTLQRDMRTSLDALGQLRVPGSRGPVTLEQVVSIEQAGGPARLERVNRARSVTIEVELSGMPLGELTAQVATLPSMQPLPPGVRQVTQGDEEMMNDLFGGFGLAMFAGVLAIYVVLVLLFKDLMQPVTILAALPLSIGGAFVGLLLTNQSFSLSSLLGLIMLMGIATKNSILLVDYAIEARRGHPGLGEKPTTPPMSRIDALMDAGHKRARPVIMTTLAMGAGMLPVAIGLGDADPSFRIPMAVTVIGGLVTSTILSLLVIPAVYLLVDDAQQKLQMLAMRPSPTLTGVFTGPVAAGADNTNLTQEIPDTGKPMELASAISREQRKEQILKEKSEI